MVLHIVPHFVSVSRRPATAIFGFGLSFLVINWIQVAKRGPLVERVFASNVMEFCVETFSRGRWETYWLTGTIQALIRSKPYDNPIVADLTIVQYAARSVDSSSLAIHEGYD